MRLGAFSPHVTLASISLASLSAGVAPVILEPAVVEATTYTVTNTNDSGAGSLRWAITQANANAGTDSIPFGIVGIGPHTIRPLSALSTATDEVVIDGTTQPGFCGNPVIELDGSLTSGVAGLTLEADGCTVRGLVINRFGGSGISASGTSIAVEGNYIGTDVSGTVDSGNDLDGVYLSASVGCSVGGTAPGAGNLISGNGRYGVHVDSCSMSSKIQGNHIGTDVTGIVGMGNGCGGVRIHMSLGNSVGGSWDAGRNVIAFNSGAGVSVTDGLWAAENAIRANSILSNAGLGIDLGDDGVTPNDVGDGDAGPNELQNFPVLASATCSGTRTLIRGTLRSIRNTVFCLEFFSNGTLDPSGYGEGESYLGSATAITDASGNGPFEATLHVPVPGGYYVTATATDPGNNTSEFSPGMFVMALAGQLAGNELQMTWTEYPGAAECWVYAAVNETYFEPQLMLPHQYRIATLPAGTTSWSTTNGVADPDSNWTYVIVAVNGTGQELVRSNGYADHAFDTSVTP